MIRLIFLLLIGLLAGPLGAGEDGVTIRGTVVNPQRAKFPVDLKALNIKFVELVQFDPIPFPGTWEQMDVDQRQNWLDDFRGSSKGKAFFAKRQKQIDNRKQVDIKVEADGKFVIFDILPGSYEIVGRVEKEIDKKSYAFEVVGRVNVANVDEVQLGEVQVIATRLLRVGESVPNFQVPLLGDQQKKVSQADFANKFVLINFWSADSVPSTDDMKRLSELRNELAAASTELEMFSICLDQKNDAARKFIADHKIGWTQAGGGGWKGAVVESFGVRSIPYYCLLDRSGKIKITNSLFYQLAQAGEDDFAKILADAVGGKDMRKVLADALKKQENQDKK